MERISVAALDAHQLTNTLHEFFYNGERVTGDYGEVIYDSDARHACIFYIETGYMKSYTINASGELNVLNFYGPGSIFPLAPVLRRALNWISFRVRETVYFEAMTDVVVYRRSADDFVLDDQPPSVYKELMYRVMRNYEVYLNCAQTQQFRYARDRIIYQLLLLADIYGSSTNEGTTIDVPLTHRDLGSTIGMARETVSREMEKLRTKQLISTTKNHHIILTDLARLQHEIDHAE